jgi:hypothetical protein
VPTTRNTPTTWRDLLIITGIAGFATRRPVRRKHGVLAERVSQIRKNPNIEAAVPSPADGSPCVDISLSLGRASIIHCLDSWRAIGTTVCFV